MKACLINECFILRLYLVPVYCSCHICSLCLVIRYWPLESRLISCKHQVKAELVSQLVHTHMSDIQCRGMQKLTHVAKHSVLLAEAIKPVLYP